MFEFKDESVADLYDELWYKLNGKQLCAEDPDPWVENYTSRPIPVEVAEELCAGCPFYQECRDYAIAAEEENGIWGGTTPEQRRELRDG